MLRAHDGLAAGADQRAILLLGISIMVNVAVKIGSGVPPSSTLMLAFGGAALAANLLCLSLLRRFRKEDLNMASTFECSRNGVISNIGVLASDGPVAALSSPWPDMVIGTVMAVIVLRSAIRVLARSFSELRAVRA